MFLFLIYMLLSSNLFVQTLGQFIGTINILLWALLIFNRPHP